MLNFPTLITAGPTREAIDAVRFLSNRATGRMGIELAAEALERNAQVTLVLGPTPYINEAKALAQHEKLTLIQVESAQDMFEAVRDVFARHRLFIASAAVADYRPATVASGKIKKEDGPMQLTLERTVDILEWANQQRDQEQLLVGFALESDPELSLARAKLERKGCDLLVHNTPANFGRGGGAVKLCSRAGVVRELEGNDKREHARGILDAVVKLRRGVDLPLAQPWP